jgi:hypothetical protein
LPETPYFCLFLRCVFISNPHIGTQSCWWCRLNANTWACLQAYSCLMDGSEASWLRHFSLDLPPLLLNCSWALPSNSLEGTLCMSLVLVQIHSCGWRLTWEPEPCFIGQCHQISGLHWDRVNPRILAWLWSLLGIESLLSQFANVSKLQGLLKYWLTN